MSVIIWDDKYAIGVKDIDEQHKKLVELVNGLFLWIYKGFTKDYHSDVIEEVIDYTNYHFDSEEAIIKDLAPDTYEKHRAEHDLFREKVNQYKENIDFEDKLSILDFAELLKTWLLKHILVSDQEVFKNMTKNN